jgi:hypothetical protein
MLTFSVATSEELDAVLEGLDAHGIEHGARVVSDAGERVDIADPDGLVVVLHTLLP